MPHFSPLCTFPMPRRRAAALPRRGIILSFPDFG